MNAYWTYFDKQTGRIVSVVSYPQEPGIEEHIKASAPPGCSALEGRYDPHRQQVDMASGRVVALKPPQPDADHVWNETASRWELLDGAGPRRARRKALLAQIATLEATQPRAVREHALGYEGALERLKEIDQAIEAARTELRALA